MKNFYHIKTENGEFIPLKKYSESSDFKYSAMRKGLQRGFSPEKFAKMYLQEGEKLLILRSK